MGTSEKIKEFDILPLKEKGAPRSAFHIIAYFLTFGFALVAPAAFFAEPGTAFFAVAFVAIFLNVFSPSQWSGTLSQKIHHRPITDQTELFLLFSANPVC
jgi:hypothetical protein